MISILEVFDLESFRSREIFRLETQDGSRIEAPNISPCGTWVLVNHRGYLWRIDLAAPALRRIETGVADRCNNDHGFTRDGRILFGSHYEGLGAQIYAVPHKGGQPEKISSQAPSWWHGLSPDGMTMVYPAVRERGAPLDIYRRALNGGAELRLTQGLGHNDGPEFSADGQHIYWNSEASGHAQIWVMEASGKNQRPLFSDDRVNWFPHPSPDGLWILYLSYPAGTEGHPYDLPVDLVLVDHAGRNRQVCCQIIGGQGSLNVPPWAPDGKSFAYLRYLA